MRVVGFGRVLRGCVWMLHGVFLVEHHPSKKAHLTKSKATKNHQTFANQSLRNQKRLDKRDQRLTKKTTKSKPKRKQITKTFALPKNKYLFKKERSLQLLANKTPFSNPPPHSLLRSSAAPPEPSPAETAIKHGRSFAKIDHFP